MNIKMKKDLLRLSLETLDRITEPANFQTEPLLSQKEEIIKDWNLVLDNLEDIQDIYFELAKLIHRFITNHPLFDGNKRMHKALTSHLQLFVKWEDLY